MFLRLIQFVHNFHTCQVPQQKNEYDCGIFMLYYIERFIRLAPERFTRDNLSMVSGPVIFLYLFLVELHLFRSQCVFEILTLRL